jgi:hypothetical protein
MDRLREAEEQGKKAARRAYERALEVGEDAQRRIRQKMRIYPPSVAAAEGSQNGSAEVNTAEAPPAPEPIISIQGRDVESKPRERKIA